MLPDLRLIDFELCCAAGLTRADVQQSLRDRRSGLVNNRIPGSGLDTPIGMVAAADELNTAVELGEWQSRNNALALLCLNQPGFAQSCKATMRAVGAQRIGVVIGSSTSSIDRTELAYQDLDKDGMLKPEFRQRHVHNPHGPAAFVAHRLGITGPAMTLSTACSSSAKVFATAARWLAMDVVDAVLLGGVDSLCLSVLHGFNSLQLVSPGQCRPFDANRDGINLGEAAGFALLGHANLANDLGDARVQLRGYGESSDAHHMSHPHPEGLGAEAAMQQALNMAKMNSADLEYVNLHGTASQANDLIEGAVMQRLFKPGIASSTKAWTGHTLGAAGITESIIAIEAMLDGVVPGTLNHTTPDPEIEYQVRRDNAELNPAAVMSNSFGFGGNNSSLIFSRVDS